MECPRDLGRTQDFSYGRAGKRRIAREFQSDRVNVSPQSRKADEGIFRSSDLLGEHDVRAAIACEIAGVEPEPAVRGGRVAVIQAQIPGYEVGTAVVVEVTGSEAEPPAAGEAEAHGSRDVTESTALVPEEL